MANKLLPFWAMPASWGLRGEAYERAKIEYELDGTKRKIALAKVGLTDEVDLAVAEADVLLEVGEVDENQHAKMISSVKKEPWVAVKRMEVHPDDPKQGYMELDWNDHFIAMLQEKGYTGKSDEDVANKWCNDICRTVLMQEQADMDFGLDNMDRSDVEVVTEPKVTKEEPNE